MSPTIYSSGSESESGHESNSTDSSSHEHESNSTDSSGHEHDSASSTNSNPETETTSNTNSGSTTGTAYIIYDNTAGYDNTAIMSNMPTSSSPNCTKDDVLVNNTKNCFSLGNNDIQVVQNDGSGNIVSMVGVGNSASTSYNNQGTDKQTFHFTSGQHLFDVDDFRTASNNISALRASLPDLPLGTYGTISFEQFLVNIRNGNTMYGIVRVKVPLEEIVEAPVQQTTNTTTEHDDSLLMNSTSNSESSSNSSNTSSIRKSSSKKKSRFRMCGKKSTPTPTTGTTPTPDPDPITTVACEYCGPSTDTVIKAGNTICGVTLPANAQINVKGALMFDWFNCNTDEAISVDEFPSNPGEISFGIAVPLNINPANVNNSTQAMASTSNIQTITGSNNCPSGSPCDIQINSAINYSLVPSESKDMYAFKIKSELTEEVFNGLSKSDQYHLLFPSGYADGWSSAFNALNISPSTWKSWGFSVEADSAENNIISADSVRRQSFSDIPALMYTGGLISIQHHTNISGLIYAAQAIDLSQNGIADANNTVIPSYQYINGAILVRDGFYFEAKNEGGITLISNNPDSYSNTKLKNGPGTNSFVAYNQTNETNNTNDSGTEDNSVLTGKKVITQISSATLTAPTWVEIRPR